MKKLLQGFAHQMKLINEVIIMVLPAQTSIIKNFIYPKSLYTTTV
jgi:hypothetical protein